MNPEVNCDCGVVLDNEQEIGWHRTTEGHIWNKLKKEMDGNYNYTKKKIPKDVRMRNAMYVMRSRKMKKGAPNGLSLITRTSSP
jgi:hypothetical protein